MTGIVVVFLLSLFMEGEIRLEYIKKLNQSIDYIENNICEDLEVEKIAKISCLSKYHFQRLFHLLSGYTIAEYIRKRRLTLAAQKLATEDIKVIDVAIKYGYSTSESFSKAFSRLHGINPSVVKNSKKRLKAYPRLFFQLKLQGANKMDYRIVAKEKFQVIGKSIEMSTLDGQNFKEIPKFWAECNQDGFCDKLYQYVDELGILGICMDYEEDKDRMKYMIAVEKPEIDLDFEVEEIKIPSNSWAVFEVVGSMPNAIQDVWKRIYSEWFPSTGYEHTGGAELEVYYPGDPSNEDYKSEIWIPIK